MEKTGIPSLIVAEEREENILADENGREQIG